MSDINPLAWLRSSVRRPDTSSTAAAAARQAQLTKPPGSLGRLETLAIRLAGLQKRECPALERVWISVFAADHGIAAEPVSAFPQSVTAQMIDNFARGGAAISVLARQLGTALEIVNLGTVGTPSETQGVLHRPIAPSTANFAKTAAMSHEQLARALQAGYDSASRAHDDGCELFIGGDMGIGNSSSATALACGYGLGSPSALAGPGTGLGARGVAHKVSVLERALALHGPHLDSPLEVLRRLGGFEIAALAGAYIGCAQLGIPALVDGFISSAAALSACRLNPDTRDWLLFSHRSAEPGHATLLKALDAEPLLDLGMRLGEGSGAAVAVPLLRSACLLHAQMATFAEAGVAGRQA